MWQIIKAEYLSSLFTSEWKSIGIVIAVFLYAVFFQNSSLIVLYFFIGGIILSFWDTNRYYLFQTLPVKPKQIAFARLIMIAINFAVLLIISIPLLLLLTSEFANSILKLFNMVGLLLVIRLLVFSLFDITSGFISNNKTRALFQSFTFITPVVIAYIYITSAFFKRPELLFLIMLILSFCLVPIFAYISLRTFLGKEKITVREK